MATSNNLTGDIIKAHLVGIRPLILHNGRGANPMDPFVKAIKEITSKKNQTDADMMEKLRLQFLCGLYTAGDPPVPVLPSFFIEGALKNAAKRIKAKQQLDSGVLIERDFPLIYDGPKDPDDLWQVDRFRFIRRVRIQRSTVLSCRPIFPEWEVDLEIPFDPELIDRRKVINILEVLQGVGLGEWWPKYGRFRIETVK